jgi:hypothetical protein
MIFAFIFKKRGHSARKRTEGESGRLSRRVVLGRIARFHKLAGRDLDKAGQGHF